MDLCMYLCMDAYMYVCKYVCKYVRMYMNANFSACAVEIVPRRFFIGFNSEK